MGKRKRFDFTILTNFKHLNSYTLYNKIDIPEDKKSVFYDNFVNNDNLMPVLLTFVDVSFITEEDKASGVMVEIGYNFTEDGVKDLIENNKSGNISMLECFINEHDLNGWTTISGLKIKNMRKVLTNQLSPYEFSKDGIEIERLGELDKKKKSNSSQMGE